MYVDQQSDKSVDEVLKEWETVIVKVPHMLETPSQFEQRKQNSNDLNFRKRANIVKWGGWEYYIYDYRMEYRHNYPIC